MQVAMTESKRFSPLQAVSELLLTTLPSPLSRGAVQEESLKNDRSRCLNLLFR